MCTGFIKFFLGKSTLRIFEIFALFTWIIWTCCSFALAGNNYELATDGVFYIILITGLMAAYNKGETNVQKAILGALLMLLCKSNVEIMWASINTGDTLLLIIDICILAFSLIIFVSHIILQSDHAGKKGALILNQCCGLILIFIMIYGIYQIACMEDLPLFDISFIIPWALTYLVLICIETRIQEYKSVRSHALSEDNWNEETRKEAKKIFKL